MTGREISTAGARRTARTIPCGTSGPAAPPSCGTGSGPPRSQVLFPLIELERQKLIEKWHDSIEEALHENHVEQFGAAVTDPAEVELGTLCYMMRCRVSGDYRMLYIPEEADRERIRFLHECRNKLAHMNCCAPGQVAALLDGVC